MMGGVLKCRIVVASCWVCVCIHECVCVCVRACVSQLTVGLKVSCTVSSGELLCLQMQPALATWSATWLPNQQRGWWEPVHLYQRDICLPVMCHCMRQEDNLQVGSRQNCMVALLIVCSNILLHVRDHYHPNVSHWLDTLPIINSYHASSSLSQSLNSLRNCYREILA